ncbi:MAG: transcription elongation factor Spt5 [Thermoplasmataceae archaeon]|jgi:transcriptional antiterminator NusG
MTENLEKTGWMEVDTSDRVLGCGREYDIPISIKNTHATKRKFKISLSENLSQRDAGIEWSVSLTNGKTASVSFSSQETNPVEETVDIDGDSVKRVLLKVTTPRGGFDGDSCKLSVSVSSEDQLNRQDFNLNFTLRPVIIAVKTTVGNEFQVSLDLSNRSLKNKDERKLPQDVPQEVISIMSSRDLKGYVFVETMHPDLVEAIAKGIRGFKGIVEGDISFSEIEHYLTPKPAVTGLDLGAFVELVDGPFKGEKAKIMSIDQNKEEVTVQLVESMVPIPVTVRAEAIRVLDKR